MATTIGKLIKINIVVTNIGKLKPIDQSFKESRDNSS